MTVIDAQAIAPPAPLLSASYRASRMIGQSSHRDIGGQWPSKPIEVAPAGTSLSPRAISEAWRRHTRRRLSALGNRPISCFGSFACASSRYQGPNSLLNDDGSTSWLCCSSAGVASVFWRHRAFRYRPSRQSPSRQFAARRDCSSARCFLMIHFRDRAFSPGSGR